MDKEGKVDRKNAEKDKRNESIKSEGGRGGRREGGRTKDVVNCKL